MLRRTLAASIPTERPSPEAELERIHRENRRLLALVAAVVIVTTLAVVALGAAADAAATASQETPELAFERGHDIWVARADGTGARNLTRTKAREYSPAWSPDGSRLAFVSYRDGNAELYVADADGRNPRRLTRHRGEDLSPAWSPDGTRIAFASNRSGEYEVYVMKTDGSAIRRLTRDSKPGYGSYKPSWSPDGRLIAFHSSARTPENAEIYTMRPDGTGVRRLTRTIGDVETLGDDGFPAWTPDGRRIVFSSNRKQGGALWLMRADGAGQRVLLNLPQTDEWDPDVSSDGRTIAFSRLYGTGKTEVWLVGLDGKDARRVGPGSDPAWRPSR